jgi:hypothetical protein
LSKVVKKNCQKIVKKCQNTVVKKLSKSWQNFVTPGKKPMHAGRLAQLCDKSVSTKSAHTQGYYNLYGQEKNAFRNNPTREAIFTSERPRKNQNYDIKSDLLGYLYPYMVNTGLNNASLVPILPIQLFFTCDTLYYCLVCSDLLDTDLSHNYASCLG